MNKYTANDEPFMEQFLVYAARGKCVRECKARSLPPKLRTPDTSVLKLFRRRVPFSYLHFAYYQVWQSQHKHACDTKSMANMPNTYVASNPGFLSQILAHTFGVFPLELRDTIWDGKPRYEALKYLPGCTSVCMTYHFTWI